MKKRICVVTGSRAEYGLLRWVMDGIADSNALDLQILATGMHVEPAYGLTSREIEADGFSIDRRVNMELKDDSPAGLARSMGIGLAGFGKALAELEPDMVVLLGDRFEIFSAAAAALVTRVPIAHLHGGEVTEGAFDDSLRHAITKMSLLHFVAAEVYRRRVIQLGEQPDRVFNVGGLGVDCIQRLQPMDRAELEESLGFHFAERNLLITFHPVTLATATSESLMAELLAALAPLEDTRLIFTMPNADTGGQALTLMVKEFVAEHDNAVAFTSMGQRRYLSCMRCVDGVVGNSSSGLIEAPAVSVGTVNVGERQDGRLRASSVIDCETERGEISQALRRLYSDAFRAELEDIDNPYGDGGAADKVVKVLSGVQDGVVLAKSFYDIDWPERRQRQ